MVELVNGTLSQGGDSVKEQQSDRDGPGAAGCGIQKEKTNEYLRPYGYQALRGEITRLSAEKVSHDEDVVKTRHKDWNGGVSDCDFTGRFCLLPDGDCECILEASPKGRKTHD